MPHSHILCSPPLLADRINAATSATHSHLNRLILERLPLALPPHTRDPSIYVSGLLHIAPIYITFENLWLRTIESSHVSMKQDSASPRIKSLLHLLRFPGLLRGECLYDDIAYLISISKNEAEGKIEAASKNGAVSKFLDHIRGNIRKKPHVILAYAWVLYMALFSGGRYVRASLKEAGGYGVDFWSQDFSTVMQHHNEKKDCKPLYSRLDFCNPNPDSINEFTISSKIFSPKAISGLHFFYFVGGLDGEDMKNDFKKNMEEAERLLTNNEQNDIILEAQCIFQFMIEIIWDLDVLMGICINNDDDDVPILERSNSLMKTRDSVSIAKQRFWQKSKEHISDQTWHSAFFRFIIGNPKGEIVRFKIPFTSWRHRGINLKKSYYGKYVANTGFCSNFAKVNTRNASYRTSLLPIIGLVLFCILWYWFKKNV